METYSKTGTNKIIRSHGQVVNEMDITLLSTRRPRPDLAPASLAAAKGATQSVLSDPGSAQAVESAAGGGPALAGSEWTEPDWAEKRLEKPAKAPRPFKILFVGVNANESATLNLKKEYEAIKGALDANLRNFLSEHDTPVVKHIAYSTWREVMDEVKREHPSALVFGSHSSEARGIELFQRTVIPEQMVAAIGAWNEDAREKGLNEVRVLLACRKHASCHSRDVALGPLVP